MRKQSASRRAGRNAPGTRRAPAASRRAAGKPAGTKPSPASSCRAAGTPAADAKKSKGALAHEVEAVVAALKRMGSKRTRDGMARYAIPSDKAFGVPMGAIQKLAKSLGRRHELAAALWDTGWYEARMIAVFVAEPERVTPAEMDRWARDFDNWAVCDTACFHLFDRTPYAFPKVTEWSRRSDEFEKRAAFALLASLAGHDKQSGNAPFVKTLPLVERAATDERNFVMKGVSWALRGIGRRNPELHQAAVKVARRLADSPDAPARWVGKDALRDLLRPAVVRRLETAKS